MSEIHLLYLQAAIFVTVGGSVFALAIDNLLPFFEATLLTVRQRVIAFISTAVIFWATWLMPMGVLLLVTGRSIEVIIILSILFFLFIISALVSFWVISRVKRRLGKTDPRLD